MTQQDPFVTSKWRQIFPPGQGGSIRTEDFFQVRGHVIGTTPVAIFVTDMGVLPLVGRRVFIV